MVFIPAPPGIARVRLNWSLEGNEAVNVTYWDIGTAAPLTPINAVDVCDQIYKGWHTVAPADNHLQQVVCPQIELVSIECEDASAPNGVVRERIVGEFGGAAGPPVPPGVAWVARLVSGFRGRSARGRMFLPGLDIAHVAADGAIDNVAELDAVMLNGWQIGTADGAGLTSLSGLTQVIASFFSGVDPVTHRPIPRATAVITPVNAIHADLFVHSQRRRNHVG